MSLLFLIGQCGAVRAQSSIKIGGVDTREPSLQADYLTQEVAMLAKQAASAAAKLIIEQQDRKTAEERAANLKQWLDLAWPDYAASSAGGAKGTK